MHKSEVVQTVYPEITKEIANRNFNGLMEFVNHDEQEVSNLAWKALAKTELDESELDLLIEEAFRKDVEGGWFAVSFHDLDSDRLNSIRNAFRAGEISSKSVCNVFFRQGELDDLEYLISSMDLIGSAECSKAIGGIMSRVEVPESLNEAVIRTVFENEDQEIRRNLLYGYYRASVNRPEADSFLASLTENQWKEFGVGQDQFLDMTVVRMLGKRGLHVAMDQLSDEELNDRPGLAIDLASTLGISVPKTEDVKPIFRLLHHKNNHVVVQVLTSLTQHDRLTPPFLNRIEEEVTIPTRDPEIFVSSLNLFLRNRMDISSHRFRLDELSERNPYLKEQFLIIYSALDSDEEYFERLSGHIKSGGVEALHAGRMMTRFLQRRGIPNRFRNSVEELITYVLDDGNRSSLDGLAEVFLSDRVLSDDIFETLNNAYERYIEQDLIEQARILQRVLEERFSDQFEAADFQFEKPFRLPNTDRLYQMGTRPFWELKTEQGTIVVRLDPLSAPFTVSSIDSLTRAGAYNGVVFHRVVRNFVAQGGDFDRRDGFGGPDYRIPTEPSFETFSRGMAGIASSGTDTEGSQFFFMHRWAPHLDGHYTNFGHITRGIDVLDKLQVGDKIIEAEIYPE
ncbi:peptidylprolyl isomerase [Rhodohalobacter sp.]|uniref:peptidylprolyl isomerase n=1 Tax=Rhodohalobacter sp. TaxID=1974210 RepID=UPI002ACE2FF0|nr:peptidylprolyl isomerase [Rhodohalobacter sp.]